MGTRRMTVAQAVVEFLGRQYTVAAYLDLVERLRQEALAPDLRSAGEAPAATPL